jgi:hypothetical protein
MITVAYFKLGLIRDVTRKSSAGPQARRLARRGRIGMPAEASPHEERVRQFQADLAALEVREVVRKHITTGVPVEITAHDYYELRRTVAKEFKLHPSAVILVGSCRQGFSIAPTKRYRAARPRSDLDVVLISAERFDYYWDGVFQYARVDAAWKQTKEYKEFVRMLFNGWIDPRGLPSVHRFDEAKRWVSFFDQLMQERRFGERRISARLYRTWDRLESYQENAVLQCRTSLGGQS